MGIATTYAQIPPLSELSGIAGMSGGPGYYDSAAAGQPASSFTYASVWQHPPATDPWGLPPAGDPQNYGGMPSAIAVYPAGPVQLAAPIAVPTYLSFLWRRTSSALRRPKLHPPGILCCSAPIRRRNYVPPDKQQQQQHSMYEPRTLLL